VAGVAEEANYWPRERERDLLGEACLSRQVSSRTEVAGWQEDAEDEAGREKEEK